MSKVQEITHQVAELFRDFGIKSLTMDDISSALGISKKNTIQVRFGQKRLSQ